MNKQSNLYTVIYAAVLVLVVGVVLSLVYQSLRPRQIENINDDTRRQILAAAGISPKSGESISQLYKEHITDQFVVNSQGERIGDDAFSINVADQVKLPAAQRELPVFVCQTTDGVKYILPAYGAGLWGPIWGYVAFDDNGDTIYGAYFGHQGETPGLGAEIEKPEFSNQFKDKNVFADGRFEGIDVVKAGKEPAGREYVHAISGGTITSQGVQKMLSNSLAPYSEFLKKLR